MCDVRTCRQGMALALSSTYVPSLPITLARPSERIGDERFDQFAVLNHAPFSASLSKHKEHHKYTGAFRDHGALLERIIDAFDRIVAHRQ